MEKTQRMEPKDRLNGLLTHGIELAAKHGHAKVTLTMLAKAANVTHGLITHYFKSADEMRLGIVREAIDREDVRVVAQALLLEDPVNIEISDALKNKAIAFLSSK